MERSMPAAEGRWVCHRHRRYFQCFGWNRCYHHRKHPSQRSRLRSHSSAGSVSWLDLEGCWLQLEPSSTREKEYAGSRGGWIRPSHIQVHSSLHRHLESSGIAGGAVDPASGSHFANSVRPDGVAAARELRRKRDPLLRSFGRKVEVLVAERERFSCLIH